MKDTIDQYMWGYQQHFRRRVQWDIERALTIIGIPVNVRVILVGFALDSGLRHQICVEPEDGSLSVDHMVAVPTRAIELYEKDPEARIVISNPRYHELRHQSIYKQARANAIVEAIQASGTFEELTFFASESAPIGGYEVHTCVGIPKTVLDSMPSLDNAIVDRIYVGKSLQHEVISVCLQRADKALYLPDPGSSLYDLGLAEDIVTAAARRFVDGMSWRVGKMPADLFQVVNDFTSLTYERSGAGGQLMITHQTNLDSLLHIRFQRPVPLREARTMRKLIELSGSTMSVLADGQYAYGLGFCDAALDVVQISVRDHATWELSVGGMRLVRITYGRATLPKPLLPFEVFKDTADRTVGRCVIDRIWRIVQTAQTSGHGTTIVVSNNPEEEAKRLSGEALVMDPKHLNPDEISLLGSIDGAIILGADGRCHAFGVILDGTATSSGDRARGSRFNSSVRYQRSKAGCMIVVISDDGSVDLVPRLMPRLHRHEVEAVVRAFCACCDDDDLKGEDFADAYRQVERIKFYLNEDQCRRVNEGHDREMDRRAKSGDIVITGRHLQPSPEMDESSFWDSA